MNKLLTVTLIIAIITNCNAFEQTETINLISNGVEQLMVNPTPPLGLLTAINTIKLAKNKTLAADAICKGCQNVLNHLIVFRRTGASKESVVVYLKKICKAFTDWGSLACEGYIDIEIDTILFIIDNKRNLTPERVCAIYFQKQKCQDPDADKWSIPLPEESFAPQLKKPLNESTNLRILHLTDIHFDPLYKPGSNSKCDEPLCCQSGSPVNPQNAAGYWGDYNVCDMPWHSVTNVVDYIVKNHNKFDFVYYTGDIISHKSWATSISQNTESIKAIYKLFRTNFKTPVFPILGNHEPHPTDFYSPDNLASTKVSTQWIFDLATSEWSQWLPQSANSTIRKGGYYTVLVKPGFRIIALNSNVCYTGNLWLIYEDKDPYDQLQWLVDELYKAEKNNEKVHILSHIPPGEISCHKQWSNQFRRIINRFAKIISAQFNGHTHMDELRVFYNLSDSSQVVNVAFNGGSFTTFVGFNPNFRFYDVNSSNYMVSDYDQFIYNLTKANENSSTNPEWYKLYSFKESYDLKDLNLEDFGDLVKRMANDTALVEQYFRFQVRDSDVKLKEGCNEKCLKQLLCSITAVEPNEAVDC